MVRPEYEPNRVRDNQTDESYKSAQADGDCRYKSRGSERNEPDRRGVDAGGRGLFFTKG